MKLPKKISPCPIVDSIVDFRFEPNIHYSAVFGVVYNALKKNYPDVEGLPILNIPEDVRIKDPLFKYKPFHKISNSNFIIQVGYNVLSISSFPKYVGWEDFSNEIFNLIEKVTNIELFGNVTRLGMRYINFFDIDIFQKINMNLSFSDNKIKYFDTFTRTIIDHGKFKSNLQIANNAVHLGKKGSLIDIDTFYENEINEFLTEYKNLIQEIHLNEKKLFISLLKEEFLKTLNPEY